MATRRSPRLTTAILAPRPRRSSSLPAARAPRPFVSPPPLCLRVRSERSARFGRFRAHSGTARSVVSVRAGEGEFGRDRRGLGTARLFSRPPHPPSGAIGKDSGELGILRPSGPDRSGTRPCSGGLGFPTRSVRYRFGPRFYGLGRLGCVLAWDWPAGRKRGPRSSGTIDRLRPRPGKTRDTSGTIGSGSEALDSAQGTRSEALGRARRRSAARRKAPE